jgi:hypothetical protein
VRRTPRVTGRTFFFFSFTVTWDRRNSVPLTAFLLAVKLSSGVFRVGGSRRVGAEQ